MDRYQELPKYTGPHMLPKWRMKEIRDNIRPNMQYCNLPFVPKMKAWCEYIRQYDKENLQQHSSTSSPSPAGDSAATTIKCYDAYFCDSMSLSSHMHVLMVFVSILIIIAIVLNLCAMISFNAKGNQTPFAYYMSSLVFCDIIHLFIVCILFLDPILKNSYVNQLTRYKRKTVFVIPYLLPILDFFAMMSTWIIVTVLIKRSNFVHRKLTGRAGGNVLPLTSVKTFLLNMSIMSIMFALYSVPKFFEYAAVEPFRQHHQVTSAKEGQIVLMLRALKIYRIAMLKFFKPCLEFMTPAILIFCYIIVIKHNEIMHRNKRTYNNERRSNGEEPNTPAIDDRIREANGKLAVWTGVLVFFNLIIRIAADYIHLESTHGTLNGDESDTKGYNPEIKELFKYVTCAVSVLVIMIKPIIYYYNNPLLIKSLTHPMTITNAMGNRISTCPAPDVEATEEKEKILSY